MPSQRQRQAKFAHEMGKWKHGTLHSSSKRGPVVRSQKQAIAIACKVSGACGRRQKAKK
jgi:hypothetical protein